MNRILRTAVMGLTLASLLLMTALPALANDDARIRVLHASPDAPAVDIYINDSMVDGLQNVPFGVISDYMAVPADTYNVKVYATGTTTDPVIDADVTVDAGMSYTIAAIDEVANIGAEVLVDDPAMDYDNAQVRVVHFSPDAPAVDVAPDGEDAVFSNLAFPDNTGYAALPAGTYDLEVRVAGESTVALDLDPLTLEAGTAYSVFAIGFAAGEPPLQVLVAVDATMLPDSSTIGEQPAGTGVLPLIALGLLGAAAFSLIVARTRFATQAR
jgi:hypothetical protein